VFDGRTDYFFRHLQSHCFSTGSFSLWIMLEGEGVEIWHTHTHTHNSSNSSSL